MTDPSSGTVLPGRSGRRSISRSVRLLALLSAGGCLLQLAGCLTGLVPVEVSFGESALGSWLLSALVQGF